MFTLFCVSHCLWLTSSYTAQQYLAPVGSVIPNLAAMVGFEITSCANHITWNWRTATHTYNRLTTFGPRLLGWAGTRRNTHPLTPILCSVYMLDSPLWQPLSRSSLVFLLVVVDPLLLTPCISSPNHHLFAAHAHTIAACSAVIPMLCRVYLVPLSAPYLEVCLSLMPHIHLKWRTANHNII